MNEDLIRKKVHQAVDAQGASLPEDPFLARRILAQTNRKEGPRMKKLSTGMIIAIVLILLSVTAVAVGLTVEDFWQQAFDKMGTWGEVWNIGEPTAEDLPLEEAAAIARQTLKDKFAVTDEELDAMGFYPSYFEAEVDHGTYYPAEWRFFWSSRTNVDMDLDYTDHGPNGEYRIYMDAITGVVDTCIFYTNNFWDYAQRIWDVGNYDEVYWHYKKADFYAQPIEQQEYWKKLLAEQGYELIQSEEQGAALLKNAYLDLLYMDADRILDPAADPQAAAAWAAVEKTYGYDPDILQKHGYAAIRSHYETGTDDIFLVFNYSIELRTTNMWSDQMAGDVKRVGAFMVSFYPGSDEVTSTVHMLFTDWSAFTEKVSEGQLYEKSDWDSEDLLAFSAAFEQMNRAMKRMAVAGCSDKDMETVARDFIGSLGGNREYYPEAPAEMNVAQWFAEESEWDALIVEPELSYHELIRQYGVDNRFWPTDMQAAYGTLDGLDAPREGDMTLEEATDRALKRIVEVYGQEALDALGDYTVGSQFYRFENDGDCIRWHIYVTDDPAECQNGYTVVIFQRDGQDVHEDEIKLITDLSNG